MKVGVALGGGAVRGAAHLGVLQALEGLGIRPEFVAGTSSGAIVGALYAAGFDSHVWDEIQSRCTRRALYDPAFSRKGFFKGERIMRVFEPYLSGRRIEELPVRLAVTAVDLVRGELVVFRNGPLIPAIRAGISLPGMFVPVYEGDRVLVDGAVLSSIPVDTVRDMGADVVVAVDVRASWGALKPHRNAYLQRSFEVLSSRFTEQMLSRADVVLTPDVGAMRSFDFSQIEKCVQAGVREVARRRSDIQHLVSPGDRSADRLKTSRDTEPVRDGRGDGEGGEAGNDRTDPNGTAGSSRSATGAGSMLAATRPD